MKLPYSSIEIENILKQKGWVIPVSDKFNGKYKSLGLYSKKNIKCLTMFDAWNFEFIKN